ncbi:unnamed protein product [Didymodactylos carnosus]|uniref:Uncharacterized protein n=1 Tax=Didymodactylos carnosus TaxID=1234261 RepID=A0A814JRE8_9BILA|nr:unnamed protein product [Didymodactylos carnosus]CAF1041005.1 unnamed protein product [Didymodactylos carnosus]CAF3601147.1 unnamed protein product [Didymodactylos carnosus]CAF3811170.1 unnamed protein product [Didymodactylos carnosus]
MVYDVVRQLKQQRDRLKQYKRRIQTQLEKEREVAIELIKNGRKDRALLLLRKKRMLEAQLNKSEGILDNVEQLVHELEFAQVEVNVVNSLRQGTDALKKMNEMLKLEDVEKLMEETREAAEYQEELTNALSGNLSRTDEQDVLDELEEILREETGGEAIYLPDVPVHSSTREVFEKKMDKRQFTNLIGLLLAIFMVISMLWGISFEMEEIVTDESLAVALAYGGKYKFLTILNMYLQLIYFIICIINYFIGSNNKNNKKRSLTQKIRDYIYATAAFPMGTFVAITFWSIYIIDREMICPAEFEKLITPMLNHCMHTLPAIGVLLECFFHNHQYPSRTLGIITVVLLSIAYIIWVYWIYHNAAVWVYPFFKFLPFWYRKLFFLGSTLLSVALYYVGEYYNRLISGASSKHKRS